MKFSRIALFADLATLSTAATQQNPILTSPTLGSDPYTGLNLPQNAYGASVLALLYGSPLFVYGKTLQLNNTFSKYKGNKFRAKNGLNSYDSGSRLSNVDTIYGQSFLDLAAQDVVFTVPPMQSDRYYGFSMFDPFSTDYTVIGSVNGDPPGDYLIRPSIKTGNVGLTTENCDAAYVGCIDSPTWDVFFLVRVAAIPDNQTDIDYVVKYVHSLNVRNTNKRKPTVAPLKASDFEGGTNHTLYNLQILARLADRNPPLNTLFATFLPFTLLAAGISNGTYNQPASVDLDQVQQSWDDIVAAFVASPVNTVQLGNGWTVDSPVWSGDFEGGTNIVARAHIGLHGYAQNTAKQSIYPIAPQSRYTLGKNEAYIIQFSGKPPLTKVGFWSLTMYDDNNLFINNPQKVYALGDRSNLTYPDGTPVYRGGNPAVDKPFQILVQAYDQQPPKNWSSNFLPAPTNGALWQVLMRIYGPDLGPAEDGTYEYPTFTKVNAILA